MFTTLSNYILAGHSQKHRLPNNVVDEYIYNSDGQAAKRLSNEIKKLI